MLGGDIAGGQAGNANAATAVLTLALWLFFLRLRTLRTLRTLVDLAGHVTLDESSCLAHRGGLSEGWSTPSIASNIVPRTPRRGLVWRPPTRQPR